ncbi:hypothetical protein EQG49_08960 [Periweissella cryptocerci]|uniref:Extracellular protein n=1 Tax=Periweissella cryptocerci TaxID=2506420 RepID=A0A4P6YV38_9LACO|nr:hypothetical protein [Periweissella cryptocerci]QBO36593.1 hypothetical protein EQG49_08960 [Periweissella cryptocerci]
MLKNKTSVMAAAAAAVMLVPMVASAATQGGYALASYTGKDFKTVSNTKTTKKVYKYGYSAKYQAKHTFETKKNTITSTKNVNGAKVSFKTNFFMPVTNKKSGDWGNPQSMAMSKNDKYMYVLYTVKEGSNTGWVIRYNMAGLKKYKISSSYVRKAFSYHQQGSSNKAQKKAYNKVKPFIKVGKKFTAGHGQSLAMNPKTGQLWEIKDTNMNPKKGAYATIQRIDPSSLKPTGSVKFRLSPTTNMGHNLTFDKDGNAYFYTYVTSNGGTGKKGNVKIYKGNIATNKVSFSLVMQGLKYNAGTHSQSMSYNAKKNELMFVADGSLQSIPVAKLGSLTAKDVRETVFNKTKREFETVQFDSKGYAYLMTNRGPEILKSVKPY